MRTDVRADGPRDIRITDPDGGPDLYYPARFTATVDNPMVQVIADLAFIVTGHGPRCVSLTYRPRPPGGGLGTDTVLPSRAQARGLIGHAGRAGGWLHPAGWDAMTLADLPAASMLAGRGGSVAARRRDSLSDDLLRQAAQLYEHAVEAGLAPRLYLAGVMHKSPSTISNWLEQARNRTDPLTGGRFLGPPRGRTAGEIADPHHDKEGEQ